MRNVIEALSGHSKFNCLATVAIAVMLGACSTSIERFASNPSDVDPVYTASVKKPKRIANNGGNASISSEDDSIVSKPLANAPLKKPTYSYNAPTYKKPAYKAPSYDEPSYQTADDQAFSKPKLKKPTYNKLTYDQPETAGQTEEIADAPFKKKNAARIAEQNAPAGEGATVTVRPGNTLYSIARANGVGVSQLARANGIKAPYAVRLGQTLTIPGRSEAVSPQVAENDAADQQQPIIAAPAKRMKAGSAHTVASGETLYSLGRKYGVSPFAIADMNGLPHNKPLSLGQSVRIPSGGKRIIASKPPAAEQDQQVASADTGIEAPSSRGNAEGKDGRRTTGR